MKTESTEKRYAAPALVSERVRSEEGFASSGYTQNSGGQYEESDLNDNGTI